MKDECTRLSHLIYRGKLVRAGLFRAHPRHPRFENTGPIGENLIVFPRTCVTITHAGHDPVIASPNVVMFYNPGQVYRRGKVSERGDHCDYFSYHTRVLVDALQSYDRGVEDHPERPYRMTHAPTDSTSYLLQRQVVEHILSSERPDPLFVEETMLRVLSRTLSHAFQQPGRRRGEKSAHRELVQNIKALLAVRFQEPLTLETIAAELHYSPFHLCRIFQQETGVTIHQYLNELRLRTALEWIADGSSLGDLAIQLGYSSHSHFTQAFRKEFGAPPSAIRTSFSHSVLNGPN